jgi:hypothetical protein
MNRFEGDTIIDGALLARSITLPSNSVGNANVSAGSPLDTTKTIHRHTVTDNQKHGTATATERRVIHVAKEDGDLSSIVAGCVVANIGAATITVDLYKNGSTVLTGVISLDSGDSAFDNVSGTFTATPYSAGDVFETVVTATAGGGTLGQGLFVQVTFNEDPQ